jgi:aspartate ammonia-lyase
MEDDQTGRLAAQAGQFELNIMMPVIAYDLTQPLKINGVRIFTELVSSEIQVKENDT